MNWTVYFRGFSLGLSLIVAIGAQNAFVLKQGVKRKYMFLVAAVCALSDMLLIWAGLAGLGALLESAPGWVRAVGIAGMVFLLYYGFRSLSKVFHPGALDPSAEDHEGNAFAALVQTLAFTWLNPHVYLDTVVLIGGVGLQFEGTDRVLFGAGAGSASVIWFYSLVYAAAALSPLFRNQNTWRWLHLVIAGIMFWTAYWMAGLVL